MKNSFCRALLSLAFTSLALLAGAQPPLKVGDTLPKQFWETPLQMVNTPQKTITLSADKDKLILLDFWATWCGSCLKNFPKMEALQKQFGNKIKILAVTDQSRMVLENYFSSPNGKRYSQTASVAGDKVFHQLFPHNGIPFIVWIKDGKVLNTTDADQITDQSISEILEGQTSSLQTVLQVNKQRPLLLSEIFDSEKGSSLQAYAFLSKGRIRAVSFGTWFHRSGQTVFGRQFTNLSLMEIHTAVASEIFSQDNKVFFPNRIVNIVAHPEDIDFNKGKVEESKLYSIDYIVPVAYANTLYDNMLSFLNSSTPYKAEIKILLTECLVLKRTSSKDRIKSKGGIPVDGLGGKNPQLKNYGLEFLISFLNGQNPATHLPVLDETGYNGKVDLQFSTISDLSDLQKQLQDYGLYLEKTERELPMYVITDKDLKQ